MHLNAVSARNYCLYALDSIIKRSFGKKLLLVRAGFYNLIGNPSEEDILNFYSVSFNSRIRPYGSISFKF